MTRTVERAADPLPDRPARRRRAGAWPVVLPALLPVALFSVYPLVQGVYLAFTDARAGRGVVPGFVGADNFTRLLSDELFWSSFRIGIVWAVSVTVLQFAAGLGLALLLDLDLRLRWLARTLALVPWAMPPVENLAAVAQGEWLIPTSGTARDAVAAATGGRDGWEATLDGAQYLSTAPFQAVSDYPQWKDQIATPALQRYLGDQSDLATLQRELTEGWAQVSGG